MSANFQIRRVKVVVQDMFDTLLPGAIPLIITLLVWRMVNKKMNPTLIILIIFIFGIVCSYLGILSAA